MHIRPCLSRDYQSKHWTTAKPQLPTICRFGFDIVNTDKQATLDWLCSKIELGEPTRLAFLNAHCINVAANNPTYRDALVTANALLPDGSGLALAMRLGGERLVANLNGTDLVPDLCRRLAVSGHSVFLLGGRPGIAAQAAGTLQQQCPGLRIAGTRDGYFNAANEDEVVEAINASGASLLLVAMGVPAQDIWLERMAHRLTPSLSMGVGGLFDFLSGRIPRAPGIVRQLGLEWTYRLYQEPARMWRRYIMGNPMFMLRALHDVGAAQVALLDPVGKRMMDVLVASIALLLAVVPLLIVGLLIWLTSPGPVLLRQTRIGKNGVPFTMFKLRSMYVDAEARRAVLVQANEHGASGLTFKLKRDPRITPIGRLIRKTSIDELPQLWNVLIGAMSLVGPRPQLPHEVARYEKQHFWRLAAKPGLTCLWQISGRADLAFEQQYVLDLHYVQTRSLIADICILLQTVPAVLSARGAY